MKDYQKFLLGLFIFIFIYLIGEEKAFFGFIFGIGLAALYYESYKFEFNKIEKYLEETNSYIVSDETIEDFFEEHEEYIRNEFEKKYDSTLDNETEKWILRHKVNVAQKEDNIVQKQLFIKLLESEFFKAKKHQK